MCCGGRKENIKKEGFWKFVFRFAPALVNRQVPTADGYKLDRSEQTVSSNVDWSLI